MNWKIRLEPRVRPLSLVFTLGLLAGCGGRQAPSITLITPDGGQQQCVLKAVARYYQSADVARLRDSVKTAGRCGPGSGAFHEIAGHLAYLENRTDAAFGHWTSGLRDKTATNGLLLLSRLSEMN